MERASQFAKSGTFQSVGSRGSPASTIIVHSVATEKIGDHVRQLVELAFRELGVRYARHVTAADENASQKDRVDSNRAHRGRVPLESWQCSSGGFLFDLHETYGRKSC